MTTSAKKSTETGVTSRIGFTPNGVTGSNGSSEYRGILKMLLIKNPPVREVIVEISKMGKAGKNHELFGEICHYVAARTVRSTSNIASMLTNVSKEGTDFVPEALHAEFGKVGNLAKVLGGKVCGQAPIASCYKENSEDFSLGEKFPYPVQVEAQPVDPVQVAGLTGMVNLAEEGTSDSQVSDQPTQEQESQEEIKPEESTKTPTSRRRNR